MVWSRWRGDCAQKEWWLRVNGDLVELTVTVFYALVPLAFWDPTWKGLLCPIKVAAVTVKPAEHSGGGGGGGGDLLAC